MTLFRVLVAAPANEIPFAGLENIVRHQDARAIDTDARAELVGVEAVGTVALLGEVVSA